MWQRASDLTLRRFLRMNVSPEPRRTLARHHDLFLAAVLLTRDGMHPSPSAE